MTTTPITSPLSLMLREGSRHEHQDAENSTFMTALLDGQIDPAGYVRYLKRLRRVYAALEGVGADLASHAAVAAVLDPDLFRLDAINADIAFWDDGHGTDEASRATDDYVDRITRTRNNPPLYIAHHYTRYLGDLSGGQAIGRILTRHYALTGTDGVRFYEFSAIAKPKLYKDAYRARLDALDLREADKLAVVDETRRVFALNGQIFGELATHLRPVA